jgi:hypothetical protein
MRTSLFLSAKGSSSIVGGRGRANAFAQATTEFFAPRRHFAEDPPASGFRKRKVRISYLSR